MPTLRFDVILMKQCLLYTGRAADQPPAPDVY
jgi:hypothetical protein